MKSFPTICLLAMLSATARAQAPSQPATLRCDPGTVIQEIDGASKNYYAAGDGAFFKECAIPLSAGSHKLSVCFSLGPNGTTMSGNSVVANGSFCQQTRELVVDAREGRTYRVRLDTSDEWKAWIEDVTEGEAGLTYELPVKAKPTGSKKERETILVMRAKPANAYLGLQTGAVLGPFFVNHKMGALKLLNFSSKGMPEGYHVYRAYSDDTFAFTSAQMLGGSILVYKLIMPCGDFPVRVYQDLPPGKVLYLGDLTVEESPGGYSGAYSDDLAGARAFVDSHFPELAGRLEAAPHRDLRTTKICQQGGTNLHAATGSSVAPPMTTQ